MIQWFLEYETLGPMTWKAWMIDIMGYPHDTPIFGHFESGEFWSLDVPLKKGQMAPSQRFAREYEDRWLIRL